MKRHAVILLMFILAAAAINVPAAMLMMPWPANPTKGLTVIVENPATGREWPIRTPHPRAWPVVNAWMEARSFGVTHVDARHVEQLQTTHNVTVTSAGWPLRCVAKVQYWWPWDDPAWSMVNASTVSDPGLVLRPIGLVLNPILVGGGLWVLLFGVPLALGRVRRWRRARRGACRGCGYDLRGSTVGRCPECGREERSWRAPGAEGACAGASR